LIIKAISRHWKRGHAIEEKAFSRAKRDFEKEGPDREKRPEEDLQSESICWSSAEQKKKKCLLLK